MTIRLLLPYGTDASGATVDYDNATESALVAQGRAVYTVNPGPNFQPLTAQEQQILRDGAVPAVNNDGIAYLLGDGVAAPSGAITIASTATAGNLTGTYGYNVTFVTATGETAPWPGTANLTGAITSKQVSLSNIPISPSPLVIARKLWRTSGAATDVKDYQYLATINDNTTTTYTDNTAADSGIFPSWAASNRGMIEMGGVPVARFSDQATGFGYGVFGNGTVGYACTAIGYNALYDNTSGRRNTAVGVYALENNTVGYENTALGVHAGGGISGLVTDNTMIGYAAGSASNNMGNANTAVGAYSFNAALSKGANNTAVGYGALQSQTSGWSSCIAVGYSAGKYCDAAAQVFIDSRDRTDINGCKDAGLIYGEISATVSAQRLRLNAFVRLGPPNTPGATASTVALLPAAAASLIGYRGYVTDASATLTAGIGTVVAGGGANVVPVFCDGTNWRIG